MKNLFSSLFSRKSIRTQGGFTLIELLVVIGILGILAASLISTIDPFEQLKKAQDANVQNVAVEFNNAMIRYFTAHNALPWVVDTACGTAVGAVTGADGTVTTGPTLNLGASAIIASCVNDLYTEGEIKAAFTTATDVLTSIIFQGSGDSVTACFHPQSKAIQRDLNTKYNPSSLTPTTGCVSQVATGVTTCDWCTE